MQHQGCSSHRIEPVHRQSSANTLPVRTLHVQHRLSIKAALQQCQQYQSSAVQYKYKHINHSAHRLVFFSLPQGWLRANRDWRRAAALRSRMPPSRSLVRSGPCRCCCDLRRQWTSRIHRHSKIVCTHRSPSSMTHLALHVKLTVRSIGRVALASWQRLQTLIGLMSVSNKHKYSGLCIRLAPVGSIGTPPEKHKHSASPPARL